MSIEHANVLSEKTHFSALGGPKFTIFGRDDLDPLYFYVSNFSDPPDFYGLPYMLGLCHFIFGTFSNEKVFTVNVTRVPRTFLIWLKTGNQFFGGRNIKI